MDKKQQVQAKGPVDLPFECPHCGLRLFRDVIVSAEATSMVCDSCGTYTLVKPMERVTDWVLNGGPRRT